jgi:hypothetical protein
MALWFPIKIDRSPEIAINTAIPSKCPVLRAVAKADWPLFKSVEGQIKGEKP